MLLREITREAISSVCLKSIEDDKELCFPTQETINTAISYINDLRCMNLFLKENFEILLCPNGTICFKNSKRSFLFNVCGKVVDYTLKNKNLF